MKPSYVIFTNFWAVPHYYCVSSPAGKYEAVSDASGREVWNEFYTENNIISARLPANLFPTRLIFSRRWRNARPEAITMKACSKAGFLRVVLFNILHNLCIFNSRVRGFNYNVRSLKRTFVINVSVKPRFVDILSLGTATRFCHKDDGWQKPSLLNCVSNSFFALQQKVRAYEI